MILSCHASWPAPLVKVQRPPAFLSNENEKPELARQLGAAPAGTLQGGWAKRGTRKRETRIWNEKTATEG